jgi:3-hydroxyisobutyrate dehydrogenase-like beta-hydroxyacid dehydrogenase
MGAAMAANLIRAGYPLHVWNCTPGKAEVLVEIGAGEAGTPRELAVAVGTIA